MTPEIKQRIDAIRHGDVPKGYKKVKIGIVPTEWEETNFKTMFGRLNRKNTTGNTNVLTISAQHGLISQEDFFNIISYIIPSFKVIISVYKHSSWNILCSFSSVNLYSYSIRSILSLRNFYL